MFTSDFFIPKEVINTYFKKHGEEVTYPKGHYIIHQSDEGKYMYLLVDGIIRLSHIFPDNNEQTIGYYIPGMLFGQIGSFWGFDDGRVTSAAETPVKALRINRGDFTAIFEKNPDFTAAFMELLMRNQICLVNRTTIHGAKGIENQCLRWIWFMAKFYGQDDKNIRNINIPITQSTIANMLGVTRASVNPVLQKFIKQKLISIEKKHMRVLNMDKLRKLTYKT